MIAQSSLYKLQRLIVYSVLHCRSQDCKITLPATGRPIQEILSMKQVPCLEEHGRNLWFAPATCLEAACLGIA